MDIADLVDAIQAGRVRITDHADEEAEIDKHSMKLLRTIQPTGRTRAA